MRSKNLVHAVAASLFILLNAIGCGAPPETPNPPGTPPVTGKSTAKLTVILSVPVEKLMINGQLWQENASGTVSKELEPGRYVIVPKVKKGMVSPEDIGGGNYVDLKKGQDAKIDNFDLSPLAVDLRGAECVKIVNGQETGLEFTLKMIYNGKSILVGDFPSAKGTYKIIGTSLSSPLENDETKTKGTVTEENGKYILKMSWEWKEQVSNEEYHCTKAAITD